MIEVVVDRLGLDSSTHAYVLVLRERVGTRVLPIWIGQPETESIVTQMHNIKRPRPLTHDLCKTLIVGLGGTLQRIEITRVEKNTYFAELLIARGENVVRIDARPSDSIAIALRLDAPIYAAEALLSTMEIESEGESDAASGEMSFEQTSTPGDSDSANRLDAEQLKAYLENLRPEDFGKFNL